MFATATTPVRQLPTLHQTFSCFSRKSFIQHPACLIVVRLSRRGPLFGRLYTLHSVDKWILRILHTLVNLNSIKGKLHVFSRRSLHWQFAHNEWFYWQIRKTAIFVLFKQVFVCSIAITMDSCKQQLINLCDLHRKCYPLDFFGQYSNAPLEWGNCHCDIIDVDSVVESCFSFLHIYGHIQCSAANDYSIST